MAARSLSVLLAAIAVVAGWATFALFGGGVGLLLMAAPILWLIWRLLWLWDLLDHALGRVAALERYLAGQPSEAQTAVLPAWTPPRTGVVGRYRHPGVHRR